MSLVDRVRALLGDDAVDVAATRDGVPRVAPGSPDAVALLLGTAREEGWRGRVEGAATAGPLRQGFGPVRDHLLGVTFVTGDGRLVHSGGRVMKNVAGYDLTKLAAGGFGAFGVIVLAHLRLRALPRADQTLVLEGSREDLAQVAEDIAAAAVQPAAHELMSPALA